MLESRDIWDVVTRRLEQSAPLGETSRMAIRTLRFRREEVPAGRRLIREGERADECCILVSGFACRHKSTSGGGRQIVSFHIPGDFLDLQHLQFSRADHDVEAITRAEIAWVAYDAIRELIRAHPRINEALWREALVEASVFREWVLNVGRRDARSRVAHMLCEFAARCEAAGLGSPERFRLPMTQEHIADATGLTAVHVNRTLRALRDEGVIAGSGKRIEIADWALMREVGDFQPDYLHLAA